MKANRTLLTLGPRPFALAALLCLAPLLVQAQFGYMTNDGAITIFKYTGAGGTVNIPESIHQLPVKSIGAGTFAKLTTLTNVNIPEGITNIGQAAFANCAHLASVTIPDSTKTICLGAFFGCTSLSRVTIGKGVTVIDRAAFHACSNLTALYFKGNAPGINSPAFQGVVNATAYYLPRTRGWDATLDGIPTALRTAPQSP